MDGTVLVADDDRMNGFGPLRVRNADDSDLRDRRV